MNTQNGIWHFNVVEKGGIGGSYSLVWDDFNKPSYMVSSRFLTECADMLVKPKIYEERCWVLDIFINEYGVAEAIFILAINDVVYRYCVGLRALYLP